MTGAGRQHHSSACDLNMLEFPCQVHNGLPVQNCWVGCCRYSTMRIPASGELEPLRKRFRKLPAALVEVLEACLQPDPSRRPTAAALMQMPYFSNSTKWLSVEFQQAQVGI